LGTLRAHTVRAKALTPEMKTVDFFVLHRVDYLEWTRLNAVLLTGGGDFPLLLIRNEKLGMKEALMGTAIFSWCQSLLLDLIYLLLFALALAKQVAHRVLV
jgi:hypothetical protein